MARYLRALLKLRLSHPGGSWWGGGSVRKISATPVQEPIDGPLAGLRVLDLTRVLAGPFCTMLLGDLGAEIIKVEKPGEGDDTRDWGPPFMGSESVYFMSINRNKKSVTVNLKTDQGQEIIRKLVSKSDVLVENYLPGKLDKLKLGYQHLSGVNPALVYCSITGFGETGPYASRGGYDIIAAAIAGLMHITGPRGGDPCRVGVAMTDLSTGLYASEAIMAALLDRHKTGRGQRVQCNLLSTQVAILSHIACNYLNAGMEGERWGTGHSSFVPYQAFKTSDGWLVVSAGNNRQFHALCEKIGLPDLAADERYSSNQKRVENREELISTMSEKFAQHSTSHWLDVLEGGGFPYGPVNNIAEAFSDPQVKHLGLVQGVEHPTAGVVQFPGPAVSYSGFNQPVRLPPPTLGQHTTEILQDLLGYQSKDIEKLQRNDCV